MQPTVQTEVTAVANTAWRASCKQGTCLKQRLDLPKVSCSAALDERHVRGHAHLVDMPSSVCRVGPDRKTYVKPVEQHIPRLSSAFRTMSKLSNHATSNWGSLIFACKGVMCTSGLNAAAVLAATW